MSCELKFLECRWGIAAMHSIDRMATSEALLLCNVESGKVFLYTNEVSHRTGRYAELLFAYVGQNYWMPKVANYKPSRYMFTACSAGCFKHFYFQCPSAAKFSIIASFQLVAVCCISTYVYTHFCSGHWNNRTNKWKTNLPHFCVWNAIWVHYDDDAIMFSMNGYLCESQSKHAHTYTRRNKRDDLNEMYSTSENTLLEDIRANFIPFVSQIQFDIIAGLKVYKLNAGVRIKQHWAEHCQFNFNADMIGMKFGIIEFF